MATRSVGRTTGPSGAWLGEAALGMAWVALGVAVLIWPEATLRVVAVLLGLGLVVVGVARVLLGLSMKRPAGTLAIGVVLVVGGVLCLADVAASVGVLAALVAVLWILDGTSALFLAFRVHGSVRIWLIVVGTVTVLAGCVFLFWPTLSLATIVLTISITAIVIGFCELGLAASIRREAMLRSDVAPPAAAA
ncbi:DUF308 domain-containing protein [Cryptosporangium minutisporangium]|uniref:HdeD family acid-resistance protein n=1 Tax=Cryptosporangium minutisporangium TaxID=113569 RepID=A0ABP6SY64_9ACTN